MAFETYPPIFDVIYLPVHRAREFTEQRISEPIKLWKICQGGCVVRVQSYYGLRFSNGAVQVTGESHFQDFVSSDQFGVCGFRLGMVPEVRVGQRRNVAGHKKQAQGNRAYRKNRT